MAEKLQITPNELHFRFELKKQIPIAVTLTNYSDERIAFKVKTTSPKKYCVRPSQGVIEANSNFEIQVVMQVQKEYPPDFANCKDKFLVQSVTVGPEYGQEVAVTGDMFDKSKGRVVVESKLKVVLDGPPPPPSPVAEETAPVNIPSPPQVEPSPYKAQPIQPPPPAPQAYAPPASQPARQDPSHPEVQKLLMELEYANREKQNLKDRVQLMQVRSEERTKPTDDGSGKVVVQGQFQMVHLLLASLIAFLLGYFLQNNSK